MLEFFLLDSISDMRAIDDDTSSTVENNMVHALGNIEITALIYKKWKEKREEMNSIMIANAKYSSTFFYLLSSFFLCNYQKKLFHLVE